MKRIIYLLIFNLIYTISNGQNSALYNWQDQLSYKNAIGITEVENTIYCATENGLFYYNKQDYTINRLSKINGLSDVGITNLDYDKENKIIIITYKNTNIDLIKDGVIINISDIKEKEIFGEKNINSIYIKNGIAYLSSSFGLILLDMQKEEIKDTYKIGENGVGVKINDCAINDTSIFAGTEDGSYYANINSEFLFDYNSWTKNPNHNSEIRDITITPSGITFNSLGEYIFVRYCNNTIMEIGENNIDLYYDNAGHVEITDTNFNKIQDAWIDKDNTLWVADEKNSLMKFENLTFHSTIKPNGPYINSIENIKIINDEIVILHNSNENSVSKSSDNFEWEIINYYKNTISIEKIGDMTFYGSSTNGLSKRTKGINEIVNYTTGNTQNILDTNYNISNLIKDENNNLWGTISNSGKILFVKTVDNYWTYFWMPQLPNDREIRDLIIDNYGQKWGSVAEKGIFVLNDNGTIEDKTDDQYKVITTTVGNGNLPNKEVYALANDLDGNIWVGTKEGICVFYSPSSVFSGYNFDAQQIIVEENGFGQYLLESEIVYSIAVDKANRKWIGTLESGVYLLSEDGTEQIYHFTTENSPLISNTILDIEINHNTGEVYISTDKGLMSFKNDAINSFQNTEILEITPNPIREDYHGAISIKGLAYESDVKIIDISGNLIFETTSNGGMAIWNGENTNKQRVGTGVYLVFSSDKYGKEKSVGKILFIQ
ncbi:MAG: type IX secretion system anionic LPS delivery protein PorZ [Flavobacteriales bacterium]